MSVATTQPSANIGHGRFNHSSRLPAVPLAVQLRQDLSRNRNDTRIIPRPSGSSVQPGSLVSRSSAGPQI